MPRVLKRLYILCLFLVIYLISRRPNNQKLRRKLTRYIPDIKYLLLWTKIHGLNDKGQNIFLEKKCTHYNCLLTTNKNLLGDIQYFDGIIFNAQDVSKETPDLPSVRSRNQKYIFAANDSSDKYPVCHPVYDHFFNWTWTYRSDSTIRYRFIDVHKVDQEEKRSKFVWEKISLKKPKKNKLTKTIAAAIFMDDCTSRSKREIFIKDLSVQLQTYNMTIDIYGKCGTKQCRKKTMKPCFWKLRKYYFFYLALEDSMAEDFVTTSVMNAYDNDAVPIVYGKADYFRYLPPNSYLDGLELGVQKLADIMYITSKNEKLYRQYFKWKDHYTIKRSEVLDVCTLCRTFNNPAWLSSDIFYGNFRQWWNPMFVNRCGFDVAQRHNLTTPTYLSYRK